MNETQILTQYFYSAMVLLCSVTIGFGVHFIVFFIIGRIAKKLNHPILLHLKQYWAAPCYLLFPVLVAYLSSPMFRVPDGLLDVYRHVLSLVFIASVTWLANRSVLIFRTFMLSRYNISDSDNLQARKIITQIAVLERILFVIIMIVGISSMLVTFNNIRQLGVSILASAGIIGIIVGLAAQKSIGTMLAGVQIAITQPIRLDDVVIVEGEWGRIEEITLTYVAIRIWDLRRLIVPITYFIEKSFQNWTRVSADLLGSVFLYTDYTVPIDVLREKLKRLLSASPYWDQKVCNVQVTDAKEQTLELRALMSAADSSSLWNLRCDVREKLVQFIQKNYPGSLPRLRAQLHQQNTPGQDSAQGV